MKVWITRYALTQGIFEANVDLVPASHNPKITYAEGKSAAGGQFFTHEWTKTREEAVEKAQEMRTKRIAALKKAITKLEKMKF